MWGACLSSSPYLFILRQEGKGQDRTSGQWRRTQLFISMLNRLELAETKMTSRIIGSLTFSLYFHCNKITQIGKVGSGPVSGKIPSFPEIARIFLPAISLWNYSAHKNQQPHGMSPVSLSEEILPMKCASLKLTFLGGGGLICEVFAVWSKRSLLSAPSQNLMFPSPAAT